MSGHKSSIYLGLISAAANDTKIKNQIISLEWGMTMRYVIETYQWTASHLIAVLLHHDRPYWAQASSLSRLHVHTQLDVPHSAELLWTIDQPVTETSTDNKHHSQHTDIHAPGEIQTCNPSEWLQTHALDHMVTGIGQLNMYTKTSSNFFYFRLFGQIFKDKEIWIHYHSQLNLHSLLQKLYQLASVKFPHEPSVGKFLTHFCVRTPM